MNALLEITIYSGVIFACLLLFKRLFHNRLSPSLHLALWLLLVARLLIPVTFETPLHFVQLPANEAPAGAPVSTNQETASPEQVTENARPAQEGSNLPIPQRTVPVPPARISSQPLTSAQWTTLIWATGALACLALTMRSYYTVRKSMLARSLCAPDRLIRMTETCRAELGIDRFIPVVVVRDIQSPALLFPHTILIPEQVLDMHDEEIYMALRHELTHLQRKDHYKALGLALLRIIHWFNPFVWMAVPLIREDMETACDAQVTKGWSKAKVITYAASILRMFGPLPTPRTSLAMASGTSRKSAEQRIRGIYMKKKSHRTAKGCAVVLAGALAVCCFTTACQPTPDTAIIATKSPLISDTTAVPDATVLPGGSNEQAWHEEMEIAGMNIIADASVEVPDTHRFPVVTVQPTGFDPETVQNILEYFSNGASLYEGSDIASWMTKENQEQIILDELEFAQTSGMAELPTPDETAVFMNECYGNLPEQVDAEEISQNEISMISQEVHFDTGKIIPGTMYLQDTRTETNRAVLEVSDFGFFGAYTDRRHQEEPAAGTGLTQEEAVALAEEAIQTMGFDYMDVSDIQVGDRYSNLVAVGVGNDQHQCYTVFFSRTYDGVKAPLVQLRAWKNTGFEDDSENYRAPWTPEYLTVDVADGRVVGLRWQNPVKIVNIDNENIPVISFEEAKEHFKTNMRLVLTETDMDLEELRASGEPGSDEIHINRVVLANQIFPVKDSVDTYRLMPCWLFFGYDGWLGETAKEVPTCEMILDATNGAII